MALFEELAARLRAVRRAGRPRRARIYSLAAGAAALVCAALFIAALNGGRPAGAGIYLMAGGLLAMLAVAVRLRSKPKR